MSAVHSTCDECSASDLDPVCDEDVAVLGEDYFVTSTEPSARGSERRISLLELYSLPVDECLSRPDTVM